VAAYRHAVVLVDEIWETVSSWDSFSRWSLGVQLVRSIDSIAANIAEAYGRSTDADQMRLLVIARGSAYEAEHWISLAVGRALLDESTSEGIAEVTRTLNGLIRSRRL
jgi:four helix bundle protein